jgi:protein-disulfide isomerase
MNMRGKSWVAATTKLVMALALVPLLAACGGITQFPSVPSLAAFSSETTETAAQTSTSAMHKAASPAGLEQPGPLGDKSIGKADAPVTIIQYVSLTCPNCAKFQTGVLPKLKKAYIDKGKVRLILREYPIGQVAVAAALAVRCVPEKDYFKASDKLLLGQKDWASQETDKDKLYDAVKFTGLKRNKFEACLNNQGMNDAIIAEKQRGQMAGVGGTPTFFVNGKKIAGAASYEEFETEIEAALASQRPAVQRVAKAG